MDFLRVFPQFCEIMDTLQKEVSLTILNVQISIYKSTTFRLCKSTFYISVLINFDIQIYNFLTKINVDSTAQNDLNLQSTFGVVPPWKDWSQ